MCRFTTALLIGLLLSGCSQEPSRDSAPGHNIVLILIDTLRADHLGTYGSRQGLTPSLDALAERSIVFEQATATSSWTRSSVASIFSSRYPSSINVLGRDDALAPEVNTLAELLQSNGFHTFAVSTNGNAGRSYGFDQGFDQFHIPTIRDGYPGDVEIRTAEGVTRLGLQLIDTVDDDRPFFLFLHYVDPHDPYLSRPGLLSAPEPPGRFDGSRASLKQLDRADPATLTEADYARIQYLYAGEVKYCDRWIGELLEALDQRGLRDEMVLMVTSDHGEGLWNHGKRGHGKDLYEEMIRIPLLLEHPDGDPGQRIATPVSLIDIAPTLLDLATVPVPDVFEGVSLLPLTHGESRPRRARLVYSEMRLDGVDLDSLRDDDWKLIRDRRRVNREAALTWFDLAVDPGEQAPWDKDKGVPTLAPLLEDFARAIVRQASAPHVVEQSNLPPEALENLRALGYIDTAPPSAARSQSISNKALATWLDFGSPSEDESSQLLDGFYRNEGDRRWIAGRAAAQFGRSPEHTHWRINGVANLELAQRDQIVLSIQIDHGQPTTRVIDRSGQFHFVGRLPSSETNGITRLDITCDHDFIPKDSRGQDGRVLCAAIHALGLVTQSSATP